MVDPTQVKPNDSQSDRTHLSDPDASDASLVNQLHIRELIGLVRRRQRALLTVAGLTLIFTVIMTSQQPLKYTATATLQMNSESDPLNASRRMFVSSAVIQDEIQTQIQIATSSDVLEKVVKHLSPHQYKNEDYVSNTELFDEIRKLKSKIKITSARESYIVQIQATDIEPERASLIANTLVAKYIQTTENLQKEKSSATISDITENLNKAQLRRTRAAEKRLQFELEKGNLSYEDETRSRLDYLNKLMESRATTRMKLIELESIIKRIGSLPAPDASDALVKRAILSDAESIGSDIGRVRSFAEINAADLRSARERLTDAGLRLDAARERQASLKSNAERLAIIVQILNQQDIRFIQSEIQTLDEQLNDAGVHQRLTESLVKERDAALGELKRLLTAAVSDRETNAANAAAIRESLGLNKDDGFVPPVSALFTTRQLTAMSDAAVANQAVAELINESLAAGNAVAAFASMQAVLSDKKVALLDERLSSARRLFMTSPDAAKRYRSALADPDSGIEPPPELKEAFDETSRAIDRGVLDLYLVIETINGRQDVSRALEALWRAEDDLEKMRFTYEDIRPEILNTQKMIETRLLTLRSEIARVVTVLKNEYAQASEKLELLNRNISDYEEELKPFKNNRAEYDVLTGELEAAKAEVESLNRQRAQSDLQGSVRYSVARIIEKATPPRSASSPNWRKNLMLALFIGIALGLAFCYLIEALDDTIPDERRFSELTGLNVLATIPQIQAPNAKEEPAIIESIVHPQSVASEAFRILRATLSLMSQSRTRPGAFRLLITSALPSEGKTTISSNLSILYAKSGKRTLLIQADMRRPSDFSAFGLSKDVGLAEALRGAIPVKDGIDTTRQENLFVIAAGKGHREAGELVATGRFSQLLDDVSGDFDVIIIDSPPVAFVSDARSLCEHADGILLVSHGGHTHREDILKTIQQLKFSNTPIYGAVMNDISSRIEMYSYSKYGYKYGYKKYGYNKYGGRYYNYYTNHSDDTPPADPS